MESDIAEELALLGNLESVWFPMMEKDGAMITTIYVGTESGFLISYDKNAELDAGKLMLFAYNYNKINNGEKNVEYVQNSE